MIYINVIIVLVPKYDLVQDELGTSGLTKSGDVEN